eukprot:TRINITY_DN1949_c0_g1_i5.p1 TRINITY_DN1949_c0_g1~~TRINITY_DN1949_c0_g1_i5.p1  ORF type:complete len:167 (+),score=55.09 TRINITY_DN1949_c0_g1_i5:91-591(+)
MTRTSLAVIMAVLLLAGFVHSQKLLHKQTLIPDGRYYVNSNEMMESGQKLVSQDGKAELSLDTECNLDVKFNGAVKNHIERSSPEVQGPCYLKINKKGTLLLVSNNFKIAVIARSPDRTASYYQLALTNKGFLRLYSVHKAWELDVKTKAKELYVNEDEYIDENDQ